MNGRQARTRCGVVATALVVLTTGCGTTVSGVTATTTSGDTTGLGIAGTTASAGSASTAAGPVSANGDHALSLSSGATVGGAAATSEGAAPSGSTAITTGGPVTAGPHSPVQIGVLYTDGLTTLAAAFGAKQTVPDAKADAKALISYINAHGGLGGHPITPVWAALDVTSAQDIETQYEAACAAFTQDNHVLAVASPTTVSDNFVACLAKHDVPLVASWGIATQGATALRQDPLLVLPNAPSAERQATLLADNLVRRQWQQKRWPASTSCAAQTKPKVGVLFQGDTPLHHQMNDRILAPIFARAGAPVADTIYMNMSGSVGEQIGEGAQQSQSAVLRFQADCIDHVIIEAPNPIIPMLFMNNAAQQHFTPRYGWYSDNAANTAQKEVSDAATQLHGSLGVGWEPYMDVPPSQFDAAAKAPARHCIAVYRSAGISGSPDVITCDAFLFLQAAFRGVGVALSASVFLQGVAGLGTSYQPATTYRGSFSASQHDGASLERPFAFIDSCTCFRYTGDLSPF